MTSIKRTRAIRREGVLSTMSVAPLVRWYSTVRNRRVGGPSDAVPIYDHASPIYKYRTGYAAQITVEGGKRKTFYGKTRTVVQAKLREAQRAKEEGTLTAAPSQAMSQYLKAWLASIKTSVRPRTYDTYKTNVERRLIPHLGTIRLDALRPPHVQQCYTELSNAGLAPRSVEQAHMVLHRALGQALRLGLVGRNVSEFANVPRPPRREQQTLTAEQLDDLFAATHGDRFHALWVVLGTTGLRLDEAMGLKWSDIDFQARTLVVRRALQRQRGGAGLQEVEPKSASSRRTVSLCQPACDALREHRERQAFEQRSLGAEWQDHDYVFCTVFGGPMDPGRMNYYLNQALKKAGLPHIRIHDLRHTAATIMLKQNEHPRVVQEMLGHSTIALTLGTYSHVAPTMHREAANRLGALFTYRGTPDLSSHKPKTNAGQ